MAPDAGGALMVTADRISDMTLLTAGGVLDSTTYLSLRDTIIKAALAEPAAVIVDVTDLIVPAISAWAVFTSARWHVGTWPEIPIALVSGRPDVRAALRRNGVTRYVPVYQTVEDAALGTAHPCIPGRRRARGTLPADISSLARSRQLVEGWLSAWNVDSLIPVAKIIVTSLVENVLQHTASAPILRLETDGVTVTVAVEDESHHLAELAEAPGGTHVPSGLRFIAALSRVWGNAPTSSGKTVWAVLGPENRL